MSPLNQDRDKRLAALEQAVVGKVEKALETLREKSDRLKKSGQRIKRAFYASFLDEMIGLLGSATNLTRMTIGERAALHDRGRAFLSGLRAGAVVMQGDLPPTDEPGGGWNPLQPCLDNCWNRLVHCLARAEEAALKTAGRRGVLIGYAELIARQLACWTAYALCVDVCEGLPPLDPV